MTLSKLLGIALAITVVGAGVTGAVAAMDQGVSIEDRPDESQPGDEPPEVANNERADDVNESGDASEETADGPRGPPGDLPAQVPSHVADIHAAIGDFLDGELTSPLGEVVSGIAPTDGSVASEHADVNSTDDGQAPETGEPGPPDALSGSVPDHVSGIHNAVSGFLGNTIDSLGAAVSSR